jgi:predicted esterase
VQSHCPLALDVSDLSQPTDGILTYRFDIQEFNPRSGIRADDEPGMLSSVRTIQQLISSELEAGIPSDRILVGGFSQGAVIAYLTGITSERKLAGVVALSGFLGMAGKIKSVRFFFFSHAVPPCRRPHHGVVVDERLIRPLALNGHPDENGPRDQTPHLCKSLRPLSSPRVQFVRQLADSPGSPRLQHGHGDADPVVEYKWGQKTTETLKELGFTDITFKTYPGAWPASALSLSLSLTPLSLLIEETIELIRIDGRWARRDGALVLRCGTARPRGVYPARDPRHHHHRCLNIPRLVEAWKLKRRRELDLAQLQN